jgi:hypothetical protein
MATETAQQILTRHEAALRDLRARPPGSGTPGAAGAAATVAVGTVTTGAPGTAADVDNSGTATAAVLDFLIPRGDPGAAGDPGTPGDPGPANSLSVGTVTTGAAGSATAAAVTGTPPAQVLDLTIPRGDTGAAGTPGTPGTAGQGVPTGGSTGQVLTKTGGADYATGWSTPATSPALGTLFSNRHLGVNAPVSKAFAANGSAWVPIVVPVPTTLTGIRYRKGAGVTAANMIGALYDAAGTRVATSASVAAGTVANLVVSLPFTAPYAAPAGLYWAFLVGSSTAVDCFAWAANEYLGPCTTATQGSFAAPATITPPAITSVSAATVIPLITTY